jgi:hypothetical protein
MASRSFRTWRTRASRNFSATALPSSSVSGRRFCASTWVMAWPADSRISSPFLKYAIHGVLPRMNTLPLPLMLTAPFLQEFLQS